VIDFWHQKFVTADVIAVFVQTTWYSATSTNFDKKYFDLKRYTAKRFTDEFPEKAEQSMVLISC